MVPVSKASGIDPFPIVEESSDGLSLLGVEVSRYNRTAGCLCIIERGVHAPADIVHDKNGIYTFIYKDRITHRPALKMIFKAHPGYALKFTDLSGKPPVKP